MAIRTFNIYGVAFNPVEGQEVHLEVDFNGETVFSGAIHTRPQDAPAFMAGDGMSMMVKTCSFETTTDVTGQIPMNFRVSNGDWFWCKTDANYSGIELSYDPPEDPDNPQPKVITPPVDFYRDCNVNDAASDGRSNIAIDGVALTVENGLRPTDEEDLFGDWFYHIQEDKELTCDMYVDPDVIVLE